MIKLSKQIIIVDGHVVGFQFNQKSLGTRTFQRSIQVEEASGDTGKVYLKILDREIRVRRLAPNTNSRFWEAY